MGKRVHYNRPGHAHELTFSCYRNRNFLTNPIYCQFLCESIQASQRKHRFVVWAYVFMPNHVHLLIYPTVDNYDIAAITQSIKQSSSRRAIDMARKSNADALSIFQTNTKSRPFQFWQAGGGYDRNIVYRPVLLKSIDYIHNNPIRAGLVSSPEQWKWSSYSDWANVEAGPLEIDVTGIPPT